MAKNELLEEILDDLSVIKGKDEARDKQLADIQETLNELLDKFAQVPHLKGHIAQRVQYGFDFF